MPSSFGNKGFITPPCRVVADEGASDLADLQEAMKHMTIMNRYTPGLGQAIRRVVLSSGTIATLARAFGHQTITLSHPLTLQERIEEEIEHGIVGKIYDTAHPTGYGAPTLWQLGTLATKDKPGISYGSIDWVSADGKTVLSWASEASHRYARANPISTDLNKNGRGFVVAPGNILGAAIIKVDATTTKIIVVWSDGDVDSLSSSSDDGRTWTLLATYTRESGYYPRPCLFNGAGTHGVYVLHETPIDVVLDGTTYDACLLAGKTVDTEFNAPPIQNLGRI